MQSCPRTLAQNAWYLILIDAINICSAVNVDLLKGSLAVQTTEASNLFWEIFLFKNILVMVLFEIFIFCSDELLGLDYVFHKAYISQEYSYIGLT